MSLTRTILQVSAIVAVAATAAIAQEEPITWSLAVKPIERPIKRGDRLTATVTAAIQEGWHLYSTEEVRGGPKPTSISMAGGQPFELAGVIESPSPKSAFDSNFRREVEFYEDSVTFTLPLRAKTTPAASANKLQVQVRFQACNDRICLAPRTVLLGTVLSGKR